MFRNPSAAADPLLELALGKCIPPSGVPDGGAVDLVAFDGPWRTQIGQGFLSLRCKVPAGRISVHCSILFQTPATKDAGLPPLLSMQLHQFSQLAGIVWACQEGVAQQVSGRRPQVWILDKRYQDHVMLGALTVAACDTLVL